MYIIDKNKDYYDYLKGVYGIDKTITYDRRGSTVLSEVSLMEYISPFDMYKIKDTHFFVLEVGTVQYLFKVKIQYRLDEICIICIPIKGDFEIIRVFKDHKHYFDKEVSIIPVYIPYIWSWKKEEDKFADITRFADLNIDEKQILPNPIMKDTSIASLIPPMDIWVELNNFISSKYNDKTVAIVNTDVDKIVNHGFDKKTSFRNPIKEKYL